MVLLEIAPTQKELCHSSCFVAPPYNSSHFQEEMIDIWKRLNSTSPTNYMYNMPSCTKLQLSLETVKRAGLGSHRH